MEDGWQRVPALPVRAIDLLAGPVLYRLLITAGDVSLMFPVDDLLDAVLNGFSPR